MIFRNAGLVLLASALATTPGSAFVAFGPARHVVTQLAADKDSLAGVRVEVCGFWCSILHA